MEYPEKCNLCNKDKAISSLCGNIELKVRPIKGSNPSIFLIGQDPTIERGEATAVLNLDKPKLPLYKFIFNEILKPLGLDLNDIYATNLVKCTFPNNQTPNKLAKKTKSSIINVIKPFFYNCNSWLESELKEIQPKLIISFGEPVHTLLVKKYNLDISEKMKECFSKVYPIKLLDMNVCYAPCVHVITKNRQKYYNKMWNEFINNLIKAVI